MSHKQTGFTLVELMIAVVIIGILGSIALDSFSDDVISANRTDARVALLKNANILEKCKAIYGVYNSNCSVDSSSSIISDDGFYTITATVAAGTYTLTATPVADKVQENDLECKTTTLTHLGEQSGTGSDVTKCW